MKTRHRSQCSSPWVSCFALKIIFIIGHLFRVFQFLLFTFSPFLEEREERTRRSSQTSVYLSCLQIFVVLLRRVAHGFHRFVVNFEAKFDALMEGIHRLTCRVDINDVTRLHVALLVIDTRLDDSITDRLQMNRVELTRSCAVHEHSL